MWMVTKRYMQPFVAACQLKCRLATFKVHGRQEDIRYARCPRPLDDRIEVLPELGLLQVRVRVEDLHLRQPAATSGSSFLNSGFGCPSAAPGLGRRGAQPPSVTALSCPNISYSDCDENGRNGYSASASSSIAPSAVNSARPASAFRPSEIA